MEVWKNLQYGNLDLTNKIAVSNYGRIKNIQTGTILKQNIIGGGYLAVVISLGKRGKCKAIKIHKAVAYMFVDGYKDGLVVNHKDGNKLNNNYKNLEWITYKQNTQHALRTGLLKVDCKKVRCINNGVVFNSLADAANWCGVKNPHNISECAGGKYFCCGKDPVNNEPVTWEFVE